MGRTMETTQATPRPSHWYALVYNTGGILSLLSCEDEEQARRVTAFQEALIVETKKEIRSIEQLLWAADLHSSTAH